ncbi:MAG: PAS-domain containing protein [Paracoccaceae bacterium]|nr:PAS-domain containing protein [Paracoccaceae bacterium]
MSDPTLLAIVIGALAASLTGGLLVFAPKLSRRKPAPDADTQRDCVILLRGDTVVDSTAGAGRLLNRESLAGAKWVELYDVLSPRFAGLPTNLPETDLQVPAFDDPDTVLSVSVFGPTLRVVLPCTLRNAADTHNAILDSRELSCLRDVVDAAPMPAWFTNTAGKVTWQNAAYTQLAHKTNRTDADSLFELRTDKGDTHSERLSLTDDNDESAWFEVTTQPGTDGTLSFAQSIDKVIAAEVAQRNFVQTLAKTFAHLPIGLAVFDRDRRLVLFNPALVDLTQLPVEFLSARPNLLSFFDHMRENRMMPEPKNYTSWREQLADLVDAARDDRYSETWNLPSGLTFKITGRPHPDGAVAFLIEDISAEISLTRRFRSELELTQAVIDSFDEAVVVFSQLGVLTFCNAAYRTLWNSDPDSAFAEMTIVDATREWQKDCKPSTFWGELRDFILVARDRATWAETVTMTSGTRLACHVEPVVAGATLVRFAIDPQQAEQPKPTKVDA